MVDSMASVYLDHAATTPVRPEVLEAMWPFFATAYANPSSVYSAAAGPREAVERAHAMVAEVLGCRPGEVVFTGGGTEADNLAVLGAARALSSSGNHIVTTRIEHDAVLRPCRQLETEGFRVTHLPVGRDGVIDVDDLARALTRDTVLVSIMLANNEVGTVQSMAEIGQLMRSRGILLHTDAIQAAGTFPLDVQRLGVDLLSLSAHKIYGPKGVGALYVRRGTPLLPLMHGGGQEHDRRSGTENVPGMVGMAVALALAAEERDPEAERLILLRDRLIDGVLEAVPGAHLTGHRTRRLPGHTSFFLDGSTGESALVNLDVAGVSCSSGSACQAGSTDPSHVLTALGLSSQQAKNGLRMTLGRGNTETDVDYVLSILPRMVRDLQGTPAIS